MSGGTHEHLVYMANQIARNLAVLGDEEAARETAEHIQLYWDPRMKAAIYADPAGLDPVAARAFAILRERAAAKAG
ncbi:formate dehydrogenase subunit delta [Sphingomonas canadensis]|uniref:Formate dehydrogenase subunit delta n=1 Tax=Sphingomonas canadensis TaxID=1219257 RepID=A0ABW3H334_9SPHN|nr:formate dehydrogenase subunit delta [Sphingomonas canadensis]MCW3835657.1 formate dehydrogenase subunit delta [Sphingomonas canadensis]